MNIKINRTVPILSLPIRIEEKYNEAHCSSSEVFYCNKCKDFTLEDYCCCSSTKKQTFTKCLKCNYCFVKNFYPRPCSRYLRT